MIRLLLVLFAGTAAPALAQQHGGHTPSAPAEAACTPEHAAMGHCTMPSADDPHAGHDMPAASGADRDPHLGHVPSTSATPVEDPHAGHDMGPAASPPKAPPPAEASAGPEHAADALFGRGVMAVSREELRREHGGLTASRFMIERAETRLKDGRDGYLLDAQAWHGGDINKLWVKAELEGDWGRRLEHAEVQALWSRAIDPWFDLQLGVRQDLQPGPERSHLVLGVQGLAPYWWEVDGAVFVSHKGEVTARGEAEYDLRITQRLIMQPRVELAFSFQDIAELQVGSGLSEAALGLRLRYQITQLVAPYVGIERERSFGDTRRFRKAAGDDAGSWSVLAGIRMWF